MEYRIDAMHCDGCARGVRAAVHEVDQAAVVELDPARRHARIESAQMDRVLEALEEAGFPAVPA